MAIAIDRIGNDITTLQDQESAYDSRVVDLCERLKRAYERGAGGESGLLLLELIVGMAEHDAELGPGSDGLDLEVAEDLLYDHRWAYDGSLPR